MRAFITVNTQEAEVLEVTSVEAAIKVARELLKRSPSIVSVRVEILKEIIHLER